jgi:hypothetical protein
MKHGRMAEFPIITVTFSFGRSNEGCTNIPVAVEVAKTLTIRK